MNRNLDKVFIYLIVLPLIFTSCYVNKPFGNVTEPDYNSRVKVEKTSFIKRSTPLGIGIKIGIVGAGAYGGYASQLIKYQDGNEQKPVNIANAAVGALAGVSLNYIIDRIAGNNTYTFNIDPNKWIEKANKDYKLISKSQHGIGLRYGIYNLKLIHSSAEQKYIVKDTTDVIDFSKAFKNSRYEKDMLNQTNVLNRNELIKISKLYDSDIVKTNVFFKSKGVADIISAKKLFGPLNYDIEKMCVDFTFKPADANLFMNEYPNSSYRRQVFINALRDTTELTPGDYTILTKIYPTFNSIPGSEINKWNNTQKHQYVLCRFETNNTVKSINTYSQLVADLANISYDYKTKDILDVFWKWQDRDNQISGNQVLSNLYSFASVIKNTDKNLKLDNASLNGFIKEKFEKIIAKSVTKSTSEMQKIVSDDDWKHWQNNFISDKIFQYQPSVNNVLGVYKTKVYNNSKYDLPIMLTVKARFVGKMEIGGVIGKAAKILSFLTGDNGLQEGLNQGDTDFGTSINKYYDVIKAKSSSDIVMPLKSEVPFNNIGFSLKGLYAGRFSVTAREKNEQVSIADQDIKSKLIANQNNFIKDLAQGKFNSHLQGIFSGEKYDIEAENKKLAQLMFETRNFSAENRYSIISKTEDSKVSVSYRKNASGVGSFYIFSHNDEEDANKYYSSVYSEKNSKKLKEFKNAYDDNYVFGDYGQGDFPVIVSVSYYTSSDKFINAVIRITEPGTYEINVEKN